MANSARPTMPLYLHGFASSPASTKAQFFRARFAEHGIDLAVPDLAPDFTHLTVTSQLAIVEALLPPAPEILLGSSLGGYLAALVAMRHPERVRGLVLFAPAVDFARRWADRVGPAALARWRAAGTMPVFHYGRRREEPLAIGLLDDAAGYPAEPASTCPTLILAGQRDDAVPIDAVTRFAQAHPARELVVYDAGHELLEVLEPMWDRTLAFVRHLSPTT